MWSRVNLSHFPRSDFSKAKIYLHSAYPIDYLSQILEFFFFSNEYCLTLEK